MLRQFDPVVNRELEYRIPRLHPPVTSWKFPETSVIDSMIIISITIMSIINEMTSISIINIVIISSMSIIN